MFLSSQKTKKSFIVHICKLGVLYHSSGKVLVIEVSFAAFLAVILGLFIPVVFLVTLYIQSEAQGTATSFRNPDSSGGQRFDEI